VKIYWANFSHGLRVLKKGGTPETGPDRPPEQGGPSSQSDVLLSTCEPMNFSNVVALGQYLVPFFID
jgi:hypothetical protein